MITIGVLCSGDLGLTTLKEIYKKYKVDFVLTDSNSKSIINYLITENIPFYKGNPRKGNAYDFIKKYDVDIIISINYLFLIEEDIINHSNLLTFNIHGSLLPKYRGRTPHVWAIINGEKTTGITAHLIDSGCDTGKIINQIKILIDPEDTGGVILNKFSKAYFPLIESVIDDLINERIEFKEQNNKEATYFGKRTPNDGLIDWNWSGERIRNWVRAQANPYPGAFSFYGKEKITIDKVSVSNLKTDKNNMNGQIISLDKKILVKTNDGAISLDIIRNNNCSFVLGKTFENE